MGEAEKQRAESKEPNKDTNNLSFFERHNPFRVKNEDYDLIQFTKDFAELTNEGMSTIPALKTLSSKIKNQKLKKNNSRIYNRSPIWNTTLYLSQ